MRRRVRRPAVALAAAVMAVGGFAAAGALAGIRGVDSLLTTTITPQPPPQTTAPKPDPPPPKPKPPPPPPPAKPRHVKKHAKKPRHRRPVVAAPVPWSRGSGGPPRAADWIPPSTPYLSGAVLAASTVSAGRPQTSDAGLFLLAAGALGLLLLVGSMLPAPAIRPSIVHNVVVLHRIDLALVGGAIVVLVGILRLVGG